MGIRTRFAVTALAVLVLAGCASPVPGGADPAPPGDSSPAAPDDRDSAAERAAMDCVTGAWVAETPALQQLIDQAMSKAGGFGHRVIVEGSIVYEFIEHGFGLTVLPTGFGMRMETEVGDVVGTITGQASGFWTVKGEHIHAAGEDWQMGLETRWTFSGQEIEADSGTQSLATGFTEVDHFSCDGDVLILQSPSGPPLTLSRMTQVG